MNWIDLVVAIPAFCITYRGYKKGIVDQITPWLSWFLSFYGVGKLSVFVTPLLKKTAAINSRYVSTVSLILSFFLIFWAVRFLKTILARLMRFTCTYFINRFFGALLGLIKSFLYISAGTFLFGYLNNNLALVSPEQLHDSIFFRKILIFNAFLYEKVLQIFYSIKKNIF